MASDISISNQALIIIGGETITSLTEDSQEARLCNELFYPSLNTLLQEHPFNFSLKRATLAQSATAPEWEYTYAYPLPSECLQVIAFEDEGYGYEFVIEDGSVLTNQATCKIKYVSEMTDMNKLSPIFRQAFTAYLASQLSPFLTNTAGYAQGAAQQFMLYMKKAKTYNARESRKYKSQAGSWLNVRVGGDYYGGASWPR